MHPSRPILRRRLRPVCRVIETASVVVLLIASVLYAGSKAAGTDVVISAGDSPAVTRTLGELLGDLVTGRASWAPTATWSTAVVLVAVAPAPIAPVSGRRRSRLTPAGRRGAQRRSVTMVDAGRIQADVGSVASAG